jgi:cytochrome c biogenesis protein CcmG/thiol:disulfide interchange protein DsbE
MNRLRTLVPLALLSALAALLLAGLRQDPRAMPSALAGKPVPRISAPVLDDPSVRFDAESLRGQVWLLNVWASWCAACRDEHDQLLRLARAGTPLYGLNYKDEPAAAADYLKTAGNPFARSLVDPNGRIGIDLGVYGVPETFVVDRQGIVRLRHAGPLTPEVVRDKLQPLLAKLRR